MGGFLRAFIPLGESGGDYLQQRSIANYGNQMRQRQTAAMVEAFKQLGPEGETLAGEIGRGLPPDAAANLLPILQKRQFQKTLSDMLQKSGGKITPEIYAAAQEAGVNLAPLMKAGAPMGRPFVMGDRTYEITGDGQVKELGAAPTKATAANTFMDTPIAALKGKMAMDASGNPIMDQAATTGDVIKSGGRILDNAQAKDVRNALQARGNMQQLLEAGKAVLPDKQKLSLTEAGVGPIPGTVAAKRYFLTKEQVPQYVAYQHARATLIRYLRSLTGVGRVNQTELQVVLDAFDQANTYPALQAAANEATKILDRELSFSGIGGPEKSVDLRVPGMGTRTVSRTGVDKTTGKKVIQYSDGSIETAP